MSRWACRSRGVPTGGTGGEERAHTLERGPFVGSERAGGGHDVADGGGERNTMPASEARTAAATADAVRVRGADTSMSGVAERVPRAGPNSAKGAKPRHESGVGADVEVLREGVPQRRELAMRVDDALRRTRGPRGEEDRRVRVGIRRDRERPPAARPGDVGQTRLHPEGAHRGGGKGCGRDAPPRPAERARGREPREFADDDVGHAPRTARDRPRMPSPRSATTTTAPMRRHA